MSHSAEDALHETLTPFSQSFNTDISQRSVMRKRKWRTELSANTHFGSSALPSTQRHANTFHLQNTTITAQYRMLGRLSLCTMFRRESTRFSLSSFQHHDIVFPFVEAKYTACGPGAQGARERAEATRVGAFPTSYVPILRQFLRPCLA